MAEAGAGAEVGAGAGAERNSSATGAGVERNSNATAPGAKTNSNAVPRTPITPQAPKKAQEPAPHDAASTQTVLPVVPVTIQRPSGPYRVQAEVATTPSQRSRGLMFRKTLPKGRGMLFLFPHAEQQVFWMKNTLIPLDMVFIQADRRILGIVHEATPKTLDQRYVLGASQFVLELPGGEAKAQGLKAGQKVVFMAPIPNR